jgi:aspartate-semialdehyde dehydrogenase
MAADVPLVVPEVNADHLAMIEQQSWRKASGGYIVTNPNCCAIGLVLALKPLEERFGIESLFVSTMQAVSGAGYPGVASLDILGNVFRTSRTRKRSCRKRSASCWGRSRRGLRCWMRS